MTLRQKLVVVAAKLDAQTSAGFYAGVIANLAAKGLKSSEDRERLREADRSQSEYIAVSTELLILMDRLGMSTEDQALLSTHLKNYTLATDLVARQRCYARVVEEDWEEVYHFITGD